MEKARAKEKCKYVEKLDSEHRTRYLCKLQDIGGFDPYNHLKGPEAKCWVVDTTMLPPLSFPDVYNYLVCSRSAYTMDQFKAFKSLEAHAQFLNGWVQDLMCRKDEVSGNCVVVTKVKYTRHRLVFLFINFMLFINITT